MSIIHPTAIVEDGARLGADVTVGAFSIVGRDVTLEDGVTLDAHVLIRGRTVIGARTRIAAFAVIGGEAQDLSYKGEETSLVLQRLRAAGMKVAIDDFGTGYSSLSYLARFPIDVIKIDKAFVKASGRGAKNSSLLRAIVGLGHSLGVEIVAEGIETRQQARILEPLGCRGQGYYYSKSVSGQALMAPEGLAAYLEHLLPSALVVTPNLREAGARGSMRGIQAWWRIDGPLPARPAVLMARDRDNRIGSMHRNSERLRRLSS